MTSYHHSSDRGQGLSFSSLQFRCKTFPVKPYNRKKQEVVVLKNLQNDINRYHFSASPANPLNHINPGSKMFQTRGGVGVRKQIETDWSSNAVQQRVSDIRESAICSKQVVKEPQKLLEWNNFQQKSPPDKVSVWPARCGETQTGTSKTHEKTTKHHERNIRIYYGNSILYSVSPWGRREAGPEIWPYVA